MIQLKLRELYEKKGLSQNKVAEDGGFRVATLSGMARNSNEYISVSVLNRLCEYFEVESIGDIIEYVPDSEYYQKMNDEHMKESK